MSQRLTILILIILIYLFRYIFCTLTKKDTSYLFVSLYLFCIPFYLTFGSFPVYSELMDGSFNKEFNIEPYLMFSFVLLIWMIFRNVKLKFKNRSFLLFVFFCLAVISLYNPNNLSKTSTIVFSLRLILLCFSFYLLSLNFSKKTIFKACYDAFKYLVILQLILAICYPVLGISSATTIFQSEVSSGWATGRRAERLSAIGIFAHPGNLGLFMSIMAVFFGVNSLYKVKRNESLLLFFFSIVVIILTLSRSSWLSFIAASCLTLIVYKNPGNRIFSFRNILAAIIGFSILITGLIFFTPLGDFFTNDDFGDMAEARFVHWIAGVDAFIANPFFGVGLNAHLVYLRDGVQTLTGFFAENPIHNIHIIILVETGIVGVIFWIYFFISNLTNSQKQINVQKDKISKVFYLTFIGFLTIFFVYGFFGWAPFSGAIITLLLFFAYFAQVYKEKEIK